MELLIELNFFLFIFLSNFGDHELILGLARKLQQHGESLPQSNQNDKLVL